jgi:hypothetical protein
VLLRDYCNDLVDYCDTCAEDGRCVQEGCYQRGHRRADPFPIVPDHPLHDKLFHCPLSCAMAMNGWVADYNRYDKGILIDDGGWGSQPVLYCSVMELIQNLENQRLAQQMKDKKK